MIFKAFETDFFPTFDIVRQQTKCFAKIWILTNYPSCTQQSSSFASVASIAILISF